MGWAVGSCAPHHAAHGGRDGCVDGVMCESMAENLTECAIRILLRRARRYSELCLHVGNLSSFPYVLGTSLLCSFVHSSISDKATSLKDSGIQRETLGLQWMLGYLLQLECVEFQAAERCVNCNGSSEGLRRLHKK